VLALTTGGRLVQLQAAHGQPGWGHEAPGTGAVCLAVCPCGAVAATGHLDGRLRLRQTTTGQLLCAVALGPGWVEHVSWSPDGQWLAASSGRQLHLLDGTGRRLGSYPHPGVLDALCWQPDSEGLAAGSGSTVQLWSLTTAGTLAAGSSLTADEPISALAWAPAGGHLALGLPKGRVGGWRVPVGRLLPERRTAGCRPPVTGLSWHPGGQWLATAQGPDVAVWTVGGRGLQPRPTLLGGHHQPVVALAWQPHGHRLASVDAGGQLALWQPGMSSAPLATWALGSTATTLHWMGSGNGLAMGTAAGQVLVFCGR
jgi:WD40 repeat protein